MKITVLFISTFLSWVAFDHNTFRRRRNLSSEVTISIAEDINNSQQETKIKKQRFETIPERFRQRPVKLKSKCNYKGTQSRDRRSSNQRAIRRRFNNM